MRIKEALILKMGNKVVQKSTGDVIIVDRVEKYTNGRAAVYGHKATGRDTAYSNPYSPGELKSESK